MKKYFEEIEILEWVYWNIYFKNNLHKFKTLIQRDWSKYFDIKFFDWKKELFEDNNWEEEKDNKNNKDNKDEKTKEKGIFLEKLLLKLNNKFKSIHEYFEIDEKTKNKPLNERIYIFNESKKEELKIFIRNFYNNYLQEHYIKNKFDIDFIKENNFTLQKHFNVKEFFSDHESLFDKNNDFEKAKNKRIYLWVKDENKKELNTLEDQINNLNEENKFYIKVNLKDLENTKIWWEKIELNWTTKYENIFILERWDYIYHTKNKNNG